MAFSDRFRKIGIDSGESMPQMGYSQITDHNADFVYHFHVLSMCIILNDPFCQFGGGPQQRDLGRLDCLRIGR